MKKDYIPRVDAEFDEWSRNFSAQIGAIAASLGVDPGLIAAVTDTDAPWKASYVADQSARQAAKSASATKNKLRAVRIDAIRTLVGMIQKNPGLTDAQRSILGITVPDRNPTPLSPEYVANLAPPLLLLDWSQRGEVLIHFGVNPSNEKRNAKPPKIAGAKIWYRIKTGLTAEASAKAGSWTFLTDNTNSPYTHIFSITEPTSVEYRAQWLDKQMRTGAFSQTAKCVVSP
ncbi:MAG: hypothetical protein V1871_00560 [Planctomycetota bacterium]